MIKGFYCLVIFLIHTQVTFAADKPFHVVIDPGHGGTDDGAVREGVRESEVTFKISKILSETLSKDSDFSVTMTRHKDEIVTLPMRSKIAAQSKGDLFLSIHANSSKDPTAHGAEFYFQTQMSLDEESLFLASNETRSGQDDVSSIINDLKRTNYNYQSQIIADIIQNEWKQAFRVRSRPIKQESFHVLINVPMPSVLLELGFISNKKEREWLNNPNSQKEIASIIYKAIQSYKERLDKTDLSSHITADANR